MCVWSENEDFERQEKNYWNTEILTRRLIVHISEINTYHLYIYTCEKKILYLIRFDVFLVLDKDWLLERGQDCQVSRNFLFLSTNSNLLLMFKHKGLRGIPNTNEIKF